MCEGVGVEREEEELEGEGLEWLDGGGRGTKGGGGVSDTQIHITCK